MRTESEATASLAIDAAAAEAQGWADLAATWRGEKWPELWADLPATEHAVVRHFDPRRDLERRATAWGYSISGGDLADLALLAAGLAEAEADGWRNNHGDIAMRAFSDRRHLLGDRLLHWAVPWLDAAGRCYPETRPTAHGSRDWLLRLGDEHRPAPALVGAEGMAPPGEDSYGPTEVGVDLVEHMLSVWSGAVVMAHTLGSIFHGHRGRRPGYRGLPIHWDRDQAKRVDLCTLFEVSSRRWSRLAVSHHGSARLWLDLAARARRTAAQLADCVPVEAR